jgi:hypothetical protein
LDLVIWPYKEMISDAAPVSLLIHNLGVGSL